MDDNNDNPYAAPQAELSSSSPSITLAQEVFQRNLFPEVCTKELERVTNASLSIKTMDSFYFLPSVFYLIICIAALISSIKDRWKVLLDLSWWLIIFLPVTYCVYYVSKRDTNSRRLGIILDQLSILLIIVVCIVWSLQIRHALGFLVLLFAFAPARVWKLRKDYPMLYGPDRLLYDDLLVELKHRKKHKID